MDDKKSDFVFGERSIFGNRQGTGFLSSDPFCLTVAQKDDDISNNRVWNNKHVLRIECVLVNTKLTSFMDYYTSTKVVLDTDPESQTYNEYMEKNKQEVKVEKQQVRKGKERGINYKREVKKIEEKIANNEKQIETLKQLRFEPEYYNDYQKMQELDENINNLENELVEFMMLWEEYSECLEMA